MDSKKKVKMAWKRCISGFKNGIVFRVSMLNFRGVYNQVPMKKTRVPCVNMQPQLGWVFHMFIYQGQTSQKYNDDPHMLQFRF